MENFKNVIGFNGHYQISNLGRIKSFKTTRTKILKQGKDTRGYLQVCLCKNGKQKTFLVHKLVAKFHIGDHPNRNNIVVDHKDNNRLNNHVDNLQYITQRENNSKDQIRHNRTSQYTGVSRNKRSNKWQSFIKINMKNKYLGCFENESEASKAYQNALKNLNQ